MLYDRQPKLIDGLCLSPRRRESLMQLFKIATSNLPESFLPSDLHNLVAPFLETPEEAYLMGTMICDFLHRCQIKRSLDLLNPQSAN